MLRRVLAALLLATGSVALQAQDSSSSVVDDLLNRITSDLNDLRYADAIRSGRILAGQSALLTPTTRTRLHLLMAAAYFPEAATLQRSDSARAHLAAAIRLTPDAEYPLDLRWRGLDSLLASTRARTFAAVLRAPARQGIGGPGREALIELVASVPSRIEFQVVSRRDGRVMHRDSVSADRARIRLPLHDGSRVLLPPGGYDLVLTVRRDGSADSLRVTYVAALEAETLPIEAEPVFESLALLPENLTPDRDRLLRAGVSTAVATVAIATLGRGDPDLRSSYAPDARAYIAGGAIIAGVAAFAWRAGSRPIPTNIAANAAARAAHAQAVAAVRARNADRLASYTGVLVIAPEGR
jgi:hypothetical protein